MKRITCVPILVSAILLSTVVSYAQKTQPQQKDEVVKITTNLVQVDALVTDKKGNPVTDLTVADFELLQDGKPQTITNFSYINREIQNLSQDINSRKQDKNAPLPPLSPSSSESGRVLTFVVDDGNCDVTLGGMRAAREGLEKFVSEQMQPTDLVAIYQTRRGSRLLQQYTSDKEQLLEIIRKIRWYTPDGICSTITGDDYEPARDDSNGKEGGTFNSDRDNERLAANDNFIKAKQVVGTIGVLRYAIKGLQRIGGRKVLFYLSDSLPITSTKDKVNVNADSPSSISLLDSFGVVRDLTALANRASVVINTIDVRGLDAPMGLASDSFGIKQNPGAVGKVIGERRLKDNSRQSGLAYTASKTGGKFYKNINYLDSPIREALKSEKGYYLLGYEPEDETFIGKKFHKIEIRLKHPDLVVSSRSGFNGITDDKLLPELQTGDGELYEALTAPLPSAGMNIRLSAYFTNTPEGGNFIRSLLYIDGKDIAFADDKDGMKKAVFDVTAVTLNEKNEVIDKFNRSHTVRIQADKTEEIKRNGLVYTADIPVKKEGIYTFRIALRETTAKTLGSTSQIIEVPDLKKGKFLLSGLILGSVDENGRINAPVGAKAENAFSPVFSTSIPAVRRFHRGEILAYAYTLYNTKIDKTTGQPKLSIQTSLYQNGYLISETAPQAAQLEKQADRTRIRDFGYMKLNSAVEAGNYALQITVKDLQTNQTVSQWIDFKVEN